MSSVRVALRALGANKLRTTLTMLGIIIGVSAVIALMSIGRGAQAQVTAQIQSLGTNLLFIRPGATKDQGGVRSSAGNAASLTLDDADAIATLPNVVATAPELGTGAQMLANGQNVSSRVTGVTDNYAVVRNTNVAVGDWISKQQVDGRSSVVVLGDSVAKQLFPDSDPVGQNVRMSVGGRTGTNFRVIGVTEMKGGSGLGNTDDQVNVPVASEALMDDTVSQIGDLLRARHKVAQDDFTIQSQQDFLNTFNQIAGTFTLLLGAIAGISLVVGGIGIMNIMLVSVTERTREIGIRKAVGARRRDILTQFLVEAIVVSVLGGVIGIAIGAGLAGVISTVQVPGNGGAAASNLQTQVGADSVMLAFFVSAAVGLFFGIYPATRASRLNPIEALRYE